MRFKGLDLNLLVVFDALMQTRSVSRAAEQLDLSQPAISSALRRLRQYFGDPILVSHGKRMFPTAYAESLMPQVRESLRVVEGLIATSSSFDPATTHRGFRIASSDYFSMAFLAPFSRRIATIWPGIRLDFVANDERAWIQLEQGALDLVVVPEDYRDRDMPAEHLLDEKFVVVGWIENPLFSQTLDEQAFMAAGHIRVSMGYSGVAVFTERHLHLAGRRCRIEATASSFGMVPWLLIGTHRLALIQERLADALKDYFPLSTAPIPFDFPTMGLVMQFHNVRTADPGLSWLQSQLREEAKRPFREKLIDPYRASATAHTR